MNSSEVSMYNQQLHHKKKGYKEAMMVVRYELYNLRQKKAMVVFPLVQMQMLLPLPEIST